VLSAYQQPADQVAFCQTDSELNVFLVDSRKRKFMLSDSILNPGALRTSVRQMTHVCIPHHVEKHIGPTLRQARYAPLRYRQRAALRSFPPEIEVVLCSAGDK
jgi:hypothetical protein